MSYETSCLFPHDFRLTTDKKGCNLFHTILNHILVKWLFSVPSIHSMVRTQANISVMVSKRFSKILFSAILGFFKTNICAKWFLNPFNKPYVEALSRTDRHMHKPKTNKETAISRSPQAGSIKRSF